MKPTRAPEELNPEMSRKIQPLNKSKTSFPRWLVSSTILLFASISSLFYYFLKNLKSGSDRNLNNAKTDRSASLSSRRNVNQDASADTTSSNRWPLVSTLFAMLSALNLLYHAILTHRSTAKGSEAPLTPPEASPENAVERVGGITPDHRLGQSNPDPLTQSDFPPGPQTPSEPPVSQVIAQEASQPDSSNITFDKWLDDINTWSPPEFSAENVKRSLYTIGGPILAILLAYIAQAIFDVNTPDGNPSNWEWLKAMPEITRLGMGTGVYILSVVVWIFKAPRVHISALRPNQDPAIHATARQSRIQFLFLVASIFIYLVSITLFIVMSENCLIRGLWVAGLVFFILAQLFGFRSSQNSQAVAESSPRFHWWNWAILAGILSLAFLLRFTQLTTIPNDLHGDMASYGLVARSYLLGQETNIFENGWYDIPRMGFLPTIFSMGVFGNNLFGLQMTAVVGGLLSLLAIYLLVWRLFDNHRLAALTTGLVAINIVHIHFSRIPAYMDPWPFCYFALFFLIDGLKSRRPASFGMAGVLLGFGFEMYYSGRVVIFIIGVFLVYLFFFRRAWITQNIRGLIFLSIGFLLAMGPSLVFNIGNWNSFAERTRQVFLFTPEVMNHSMGKYSVSTSFDVLLTQIRLSILMFNHSTDSSTQFGFAHPMFSSLVSPLILLGLGLGLRRWKEPGMVLIFVWLGLMTVLGSVLTVDAPFWPRLVGIIPAAALLIAVALDQIMGLTQKLLGTNDRFFPIVLAAIFLVWVGWQNWNLYYTSVRANAHTEALIGRYINALPEDVTACSLLVSQPLIVRETYFLVWPRKVVDLKPDAPDSELENCTGSRLVWVISPELNNRLDAIRKRWPTGTVQEYTVFNTYTLTFYLVGVNPNGLLPVNSSNPHYSDAIMVVIGGLLIAFLVWLIGVRILHVRQLGPPIPARSIVTSFNSLPTSHFNRNSFSPVPSPDTLKSGFKKGWVDFTKTLTNWYEAINALEMPKIYWGVLGMVLLALFAVGLAYFGQTFFDQQKAGEGLHLTVTWFLLADENQRLLVGSIMIALAGLFWTLATTYVNRKLKQDVPAEKALTAEAPPETSTPLIKRPKNQVLVAGLACTFSAMFIYALAGENGLVRWLWGIGLVLFLASLFLKKNSATVPWVEESPKFRWYHVLAVLGVLALAYSLRVYRLYDIPRDLATDIASVGITIRGYLLGMHQRLVGNSEQYGNLSFSFFPYWISMALAGNNLFGYYYGTVIMGTLNILGSYLFVWRAFDKHRLALFTALLMTVNPGHINYSRIATYMDPWFFGFFALFLFFDGLKGRRKVSLALAGVLTGFTISAYSAGKAIIPMFILVLIYAWFYRRKWVSDNASGFRWMLLGLVATIGPNLVWFIFDFSSGYMVRVPEVFLFSAGVMNHLKYTYQTDSVWGVVWQQIRLTAFMFNFATDKSAQFAYPHPLFNALVSPLLFLGLGMTVRGWRKPGNWFVLSSFVLILVTGGVLTDNAPTWSRLVGIIPLAALLIAMVLDEFFNLLEKLSLKPFVPFLFAAVLMWISVIGITDWNTYISVVETYARPIVRVGRYLDTLPKNITTCGITDGFPMDQEEIRFLAWPRQIVNVPSETTGLTPDICPGESVVWILSPPYVGRLPELQAKWPDGIVEEHHLETGELMFTSYLVSKSSDTNK